MALTPSNLFYMVVDSGSGTSVLVVHSTNQGLASSIANCVIPLNAGHNGGTIRIQSDGEAGFDGAQVVGSSGTLYDQIALNVQTVDTTINYTSAETSLSLRFSKDTSQNIGADMVTFTVTETSNVIAATALSVTTSGVLTAATNLTMQSSLGISAADTVLNMQAAIGIPIANSDLTMQATTGSPAANTALTVSWPTGTASAPSALTLTAAGALSAQTALALVDASQNWPLWSMRVLIDGVDVSARIKGKASVEAVEGAARIAQFSMLPASGVVAPLSYVGKMVSIDYVLVIAGTPVSRRLFTGRIDTPRYAIETGLLDLTCVDDLQNRVAALDRSVIDMLVGGRYALAVQGDILDGWDYAQARLSTIAASLDAGASSDMRVTAWQSGTIWATFSDGDLLFSNSTLSLPQRSTLVNSVTVTFQYRYNRLRQRYSNIAFSAPVNDIAAAGYRYPTRSDIDSAASGTGWTITKGIYMPAPASIPHPSGGFIYPDADSIDLAIIYMTQRHSQVVTENYSLPVYAPESIAANGELPFAIRGALSSNFDGNAWESALDVAPLMDSGGDMDYSPDATRSDSDYAIQTLLDQARVKILSTHRSARVGNATLLNPDLDLDKRIAINTAMVTAEGKVAAIRHLMDLDAGSALTEFEIACFGVGGAGIITPDTLSPPVPPAAATETQNWLAEFPSLYVNVYGMTPYQEGLMGLLINPPESITVHNVPTPDGPATQSLPNLFYIAGSYPVTGFRVKMPGVVDADRNPLDKQVSSSYQIIVPSDPLTLTAP